MHSIRILAALLSLATLIGGARAQSNSGAPSSENSSPDSASSRMCVAYPVDELLKRSYEFYDPKATDFPIEMPVVSSRADTVPSENTASSIVYASNLKKGPEGGSVLLRITRLPNAISAEDWQNSYVYGLARTKLDAPSSKEAAEARDASHSARPFALKQITMAVREKTPDHMLLDTILPTNPSSLASYDWTLVPVLCGGSRNKVLGYASVPIVVTSVWTAGLLALALILLFWFAISFAAYLLYKNKLALLWDPPDAGEHGKTTIKTFIPWQKKMGEKGRRIFYLFECCNPIFISQDSLGYGSISRFQILFFTTVVGWVLLFFFLHSAALSNVSDTVLLLLGVTVAGGTFARAASDWSGIKDDTRQWLLGSKILQMEQGRPRFSDLLNTQGELDVAKIQALLFTTLIGLNILASGLIGLSSFALPSQIVYLAMISQGALVFGKLLPTDTRRQVEADVRALKSTAERLRSNLATQTEFDQAVSAAKNTLSLTYGELFDEGNFKKAVAALSPSAG